MSSPLPPTGAAPSARLVSLDALRGFDMFWILGADALVQALGGLSDAQPVQFLANQLEHKRWAGFAFYDLIFPLFVFIVGVSLVFSLTKIVERDGRAGAVRRILWRSALLFLLGIFYNGGLSGEWTNIRLVGVLQRIAVAYAATGLLFCFFKPRLLAATAVALLVGYWALLTFVPIRDIQLERSALQARIAAQSPSGAENQEGQNRRPTVKQAREQYDATTTYVTGRYEPGLNVANHFDFNFLPGGRYDTYWDPEGLLSTLPSIATCLLGVFAGLLLRRPDLRDTQKLTWLLIGGAAALALGFLWGMQFPVIKKIWTSSFVLVAGGWSLLLLGVFYYLVDIRQWRRWCEPFVWIGMNPITLYLLTNVVNFNGIAKRLAGGDITRFLDTAVAKGIGNLVVTLIGLALIVLLARFLYKRQIFIRV
jgi:predicted acyltransferase